jgi:hypothetical protein
LKNIDGRVISTTHLLDSIANIGIENIKVVNAGIVQEPGHSNELANRLAELSGIENAKLKALSLYQKIVLLDDVNDWEIFKLLLKRKLLALNDDSEAGNVDKLLARIAPVKAESGWEAHSSSFAEKKILYVESFYKFIAGQSKRTTDIYLICDRDNLPLKSIGKPKCSLLVGDKDITARLKHKSINSHLLSWRRREIKHYLLSYTALGERVAVINNDDLAIRAHLIPGCNGDYLAMKDSTQVRVTVSDTFNDQLATLPSDTVKPLVSPHIEILTESDGKKGFNLEMAADYISKIPPDEISEDIVNMYRFLVGEQ